MFVCCYLQLNISNAEEEEKKSLFVAMLYNVLKNQKNVQHTFAFAAAAYHHHSSITQN